MAKYEAREFAGLIPAPGVRSIGTFALGETKGSAGPILGRHGTGRIVGTGDAGTSRVGTRHGRRGRSGRDTGAPRQRRRARCRSCRWLGRGGQCARFGAGRSIRQGREVIVACFGDYQQKSREDGAGGCHR